jgi:hypothetical protein
MNGDPKYQDNPLTADFDNSEKHHQLLQQLHMLYYIISAVINNNNCSRSYYVCTPEENDIDNRQARIRFLIT